MMERGSSNVTATVTHVPLRKEFELAFFQLSSDANSASRSHGWPLLTLSWLLLDAVMFAVVLLNNVWHPQAIAQSALTAFFDLYPFLPRFELDYQFYVFMLALACSCLVACFTVALLSAYFVHSRKMRQHWPLYLYAGTSTLARTLLLVPLLHVLLLGVVADFDPTDREAGYLVAFPSVHLLSFPHLAFAIGSVIMMVCYAAYLLVVSTTAFDPDLKSERPLSAPHGRVQGVVLACHFAIMLFSSVTVPAIQAGLLLCALLLQVGVVAFFLPHYRQWVNDLRAALLAALLPLPLTNWAVFEILAWNVPNSSELIFTLLAWTALVSLACGLAGLACCELSFRLRCSESYLAPRKKDRAALTEAAGAAGGKTDALLTPNEVLWGEGSTDWRGKLHALLARAFQTYELPFAAEICARCHRYRIMRADDVALAHYSVAMLKWPSSTYIMLALARMQLFVGRLQLFEATSRQLEDMKVRIDTRYLQYSLERDYKEVMSSQRTRSGMDLSQYIQFERDFGDLKEIHAHAVYNYLHFWRWLHVRRDTLSIPDVERGIRQVLETTESCSEQYAQLLSRHPKNVQLLKAYGHFLEDLKNNRHHAQRYFSEAKRRQQGWTEQADGDEGEAGFAGFIDQRMEALITINTVGCIQDANALACKLFGYKKDQLVGRNVRILMPSPYSEQHDSYLDRYNRGGEARLVGMKGRTVEGLSSSGKRLNLFLTLSKIELDGETLFAGVLRKLKDNRRVLRMTKAGIIRTITPAACKFFGYTVNELVNQNIKLLVPVPHKEAHDEYLKNYLEGKPSNVVGRKRLVSGDHKQGYLRKVLLEVAAIRGGTGIEEFEATLYSPAELEGRITVDMSHSVLSGNSDFRQLFGIDKDMLVGTNVTDVLFGAAEDEEDMNVMKDSMGYLDSIMQDALVSEESNIAVSGIAVCHADGCVFHCNVDISLSVWEGDTVWALVFTYDETADEHGTEAESEGSLSQSSGGTGLLASSWGTGGTTESGGRNRSARVRHVQEVDMRKLFLTRLTLNIRLSFIVYFAILCLVTLLACVFYYSHLFNVDIMARCGLLGLANIDMVTHSRTIHSEISALSSAKLSEAWTSDAVSDLDTVTGTFLGELVEVCSSDSRFMSALTQSICRMPLISLERAYSKGNSTLLEESIDYKTDKAGLIFVGSALVRAADFLYSAAAASGTDFVLSTANFFTLLTNAPDQAFKAITSVLDAEYFHGVTQIVYFQLFLLAATLVTVLVYVFMVMLFTLRTLRAIRKRKNSIFTLFFKLNEGSMQMLGYKRMHLEKVYLLHIRDVLLREGLDWKAEEDTGISKAAQLQLGGGKHVNVTSPGKDDNNKAASDSSRDVNGKSPPLYIVDTVLGGPDGKADSTSSSTESVRRSNHSSSSESTASIVAPGASPFKQQWLQQVPAQQKDSLTGLISVSEVTSTLSQGTAVLKQNTSGRDIEAEAISDVKAPAVEFTNGMGRNDDDDIFEHNDSEGGSDISQALRFLERTNVARKATLIARLRDNLCLRFTVTLLLPMLFTCAMIAMVFAFTALLIPVQLDISRSQERQLQAQGVRFHAWEFILSEGSGRDTLEGHVDDVERLHKSLVYSIAGLGSAHRYPAQAQLLFEDACIRKSSSDCRESGETYYTETRQGLHALVLLYVVHARSLLSLDTSYNVSNVVYDFIWDVGNTDLRDGLARSTELYEEESTQITYASLVLQFACLVLMAGLFTLSYSLMLRPLIRHVEDDVQQISGLLKLFPPKVIGTDDAVCEFMEDLIRQTQNVETET